jgi:CDP-diacylglycerol--serine O-phosphatidyltransferase
MNVEPTAQARGEDGGRAGERDRFRRPRVKAYDVGPDAKVHGSRAHRRRRLGRHRRRAYIRSVYFLPSLATLGNAVCGFGAMYIAAFDPTNVGADPVARALLHHKFLAAAYLIILAMVFDALDGRLARFARHTTDFGGQLDSLADVISFGAAPAFIALMLFKEHEGPVVPFAVSRLVWAIGALYFSCAAIRLARFNVSNEHGEQHHFSFLGLPSPGAAAAVIGTVLIQQDLRELGLDGYRWARAASGVFVYVLPVIVLATGLLMVSAIRYPHMVNRYLRGRRSIGRLLAGVAVLLMVVVAHRYAFGIGSIAYALYGPFTVAYAKLRPRAAGFPVVPRTGPGADAPESAPPTPAPR